MNDVLPVQVGQCGRDLSADVPRLLAGDRQFAEPVVQRLARNAFDDDVRLLPEIAAAETAGTCGPASRGTIICSISKLTMAAGSSPSDIRGIFISSGTLMPGWLTLHSVAMPPRCTHSPIVKPSSTAPVAIIGLLLEGLAIVHFPTSSRSASQCGRPLARIRFAAASTS
jgi:hypothetical protein